MRILTTTLALLMAAPCFAGPQEKKSSPVDLMSKAELGDGKAAKGWKAIWKGLGATAEVPDREVLTFDYSPVPAEYDLALTIERVNAEKSSFDVGLIVGDHACAYTFDGDEGTKSWLYNIGLRVHPDMAPGGVFQKGKLRAIKLMIRKNTLEILVDGKKFWKSKPIDWTEASLHEKIHVPEKGKPFLVANSGAWKVSGITIMPVSSP